MTITFDFETKSYADLKKVGTEAYAADPTTDVICACWGIDDEPIQSWWPGKNKTDAMPYDLYHALFAQEQEVEAHKADFELMIWRYVMARKYGWREPAIDQWRDTMAVACYYALPAALDRLARVLGFQGKDPEGARLITKYSKLYLKTAKTVIPPEDFAKFVKYCGHDVRMEQSMSDYMGDLPERELAIYQLYLRVSMRGLHLDKEGIDAATEVVEQRAETLTAEFRKLTGLNPTQGKKLLVWFEKQGLPLDNMQAAYLEELLKDGEIPSGHTRRALEIRLAINKASTKKLDAMSRQRGAGGRARFQTRYHGAVTGRETGSGFQPLNLNRGFDGMDPAQLARDIMYRDAAYLDALYGDATAAVAAASRYWIQAQPGNKILAGDYVSIEAVILSCVAGEQWKIDAFTRGDKIYELMADKIYGLAPGTVSKATHPQERQDGKTGELAFGYQGALGAWLKFDSSGRHTDDRIIEICKSWRAEHPATVALWRGLGDAAIKATQAGSNETEYNGIFFECVDEWLTMILPDGKRLWYWKPELRMQMPQWHQPLTKADCALGKCDCEPRVALSYMAQKTGQWKRVFTYGGKLTENYVQATSRQALEMAKLRVAAAYDPVLRKTGFLREDESSIILTVYDEIVVEVPEDFSSEAEFNELLNVCPGPGAEGWPLRAKIWTGERYKK